MSYIHSDGMLSTNNSVMFQNWQKIKDDHESSQCEWSQRLSEMGVKLEHPDDGWVNRGPEPYLVACYPAFDNSPQVGDLIALGWPWERKGEARYRLVEVTRIQESMFGGSPRYYFKDEGRRA